MKQFRTKWMNAAFIIATLFTACSKDDMPAPGKPGGGNPPPPPAPAPNVTVRVGIQVGGVFYDSIPATVRLTTWDSSGAVQEKILALDAGANRLELPKNGARYRFSLSKWGVSDEITLARNQIGEYQAIILGGSRAAKKLTLEERFSINGLGESKPSGKTVYEYDAVGRLAKIVYYQKTVWFPDLRLSLVDKFVYSGARVQRIDRYESHDTTTTPTSTTEFTYDASGRITHMHSTQSTESFVAVAHGGDGKNGTLTANYRFSNGGYTDNTMVFAGGNKVAYSARSANGGGESGSFSYDFNINPYIHMTWPDLWFSNTSRNNVAGQKVSYSGSYPSGVPYQYEYTYDSDGYPTTQLKSFKGYTTGEHLYTIKTIYTY